MNMSSSALVGRGESVWCRGPFLGLGLSIASGLISSWSCDGWADFNFEIVGFPFLVEGVPCALS